MDISYNKSQNILPALLTIENGTSVPEKINKVTPLEESIGSKYQKSFDDSISNSIKSLITEDRQEFKPEVSCLHHISILSGPILACAHAAVFCLVPYHNVLNEPKYWYEFQLSIMVATLPICYVIGILLMTEIMGNFVFERRWLTYVFLISLATVCYVGFVMAYWFVWTYLLEYTLPMAFSMYIPANMAFTVMFIVLWFR